MQKINPNFEFLIKNHKKQKGILLQGSSRSGKTISVIDFLIWYCCQNENKIINIVKQTYNEFKTTLYLDFNKRLNDFDLDNPFSRKKEVSYFKIFNNTINFLGADQDKKFHGASCDVLWLNEFIYVPKKVFDQSEMRCREFFIGDFNPSETFNYVFTNVMNRDDVVSIKTTFKDNPFISKGELNKILSYEPNERNILQGTADDYMWKVYGLGEKAEIKGAIYTKYKEIETYDFNNEEFYGIDFGYTSDPTSLTKYKREGNDIITELLIYEPIPEPSILAEKLEELNISKDKLIICDSSDRYANEDGVKNFVKELRNDFGFEAKKISKNKSKMYWLGKAKKYTINVVKNKLSKFALNELESYKMMEIQGISINKPEDKNDHYCDSFLYCFMSEEQSYNSSGIIW